ncbi:MAG: hypothetical protein ACUVTB_00825 [Candidatus Bathycorpusculaceae bacterium]
MNLGDDDGEWVDLPFQVAFYTGPGGLPNSSLYSKVWMCSNGFLCFDNNSTSPKSQHSTESPNTRMAPYWSDLDPSGGVISYYLPPGLPHRFVISWYNVLDKKNGMRQTFDVIIYKRAEVWPDCRVPNKFVFQYRNVTWSYYAIYNVEDQAGYKGWFSSLSEDIKSLVFMPLSTSPEIRYLSIQLEKQDSNAKIHISPEWLDGVNLMWETPVPTGEPFYETALKGWGTLLIGTLIGLAHPVAGLLWSTTLVTLETVSAYSKAMWPLKISAVDRRNANETESLAYVGAPAAGDNPTNWPVDASLGAEVYWIFTDDNARDHSLKITANLTYYSYKTQRLESVTTSVNLNVVCEAGNTISTARYAATGEYLAYLDDPYDKDDYYNISVLYGEYIEIIMRPTQNMNFDLYLYNRQGNLVAYSNRTNDDIEDITYKALYTGNYSIRVNVPPGGGRGLYKLKIEVSDTPPGGCPFIYVWNGTQYIIDNNLLPTSEVSSGQDVENYYKLEQTLIPKYEGKLLSWYSLQIGEFEKEHSYIDQIKLFAVDHASDVKVAVTSNGEILTYKNPHPPILCIDNQGNDVLEKVKTVDNQYHQGNKGAYLLINFGNIDITNGAKLILRVNQELIPKSPCIQIQILNYTGSWVDIETVQTRVNMSTQLINLKNHLSERNGELKIRLYFTAKHKIDYVALDNTPQTNITIHQCIMVSAIHSEKRSVLNKLLLKDKVYAELLPSQYIRLTFTAPRTTEKRTFILYINGHYCTLKP